MKSYHLQRPGLIVGSDMQYKQATPVKGVYLHSFTSGNFNAVLHTSSERVHILLDKFNHERKLFFNDDSEDPIFSFLKIYSLRGRRLEVIRRKKNRVRDKIQCVVRVFCV